VEALAYQPDTERDYHLAARLLWTLEARHAELDEAIRGAAYGPGASEVHVLGGSSTGLDARLQDPLVRELRRLAKPWRFELEQLLTGTTCTACGTRFRAGLEVDLERAFERASETGSRRVAQA
jgi:hypothetical protein